MDTLGIELGYEENEWTHMLGSKALSNKQFWGASHRDKILEFADHVDNYKTNSAY